MLRFQLAARERHEDPIGLRPDYLTFEEAARLLPGYLSGRTPSRVSLWRWTNRGLNGAKLRYVVVKRVRYTTRTWLAEFLRRAERGAERRGWLRGKRMSLGELKAAAEALA